MATELSSNDWFEILQHSELTKEIDINIFQALYSFPGHQAPASQIGLLLGYQGKNTSSPLNSEVGRYAKRIAKLYDIDFTRRNNQKYKFWDLFFNGWMDGNYFIWQLKPELTKALELLGITGEEQFPNELPKSEDEILHEGLKKTVTVNSFERNPKARTECIKYWKPICSVCGFNFESIYGELGKGFIHVHHLKPISEIAKSYQVNPERDLRPICPNCHAMLHKRNPPLSIEELKLVVEQNSDSM